MLLFKIILWPPDAEATGGNLLSERSAFLMVGDVLQGTGKRFPLALDGHGKMIGVSSLKFPADVFPHFLGIKFGVIHNSPPGAGC